MSEIIHADVDIGLLENADCLFRNDDAGVFIEVLQNARRAGATRVDVSIEEITGAKHHCIVTVQDDGRGIDNFKVLLRLGKSKWDSATQISERPAGMGFYSLCHSDVDVHSGNRCVTLSPEVFLNKADAYVEQCEEFIAGTKLRFRRQSTKVALLAALRRVTEFLPLEVHLEGEVLPIHDFLAGSLYRELIHGIEVGFAVGFDHADRAFYDDNWNFYGARIRHMPMEIRGLIPPGTSQVLSIRARFQVLETAVVKLQLPDRKAVVEDDALRVFMKQARAAAYRFLQTLPEHALAHKDWEEAKELGIELPEAAHLLTTWHAYPQDSSSDGMFGVSETRILPNLESVIIASRSLDNSHTFEGALNSGATLDWSVYQDEPIFAGYSWYDQLPTIEDCAVLLDGMEYEEWGSTTRPRPDRIELALTIQQANQADRTLLIEAPIHVNSEEVNEIGFVATRNSPWDNDQLQGPFCVVEFLMWATFSPSDDCEADSWETQRYRYEEDVEQEVNHYFRGPRATLLALLGSAIEWQATRLAEQLGVTEIRFTRSEHSWDAQLVTDAPTEPQAAPQTC